ncbi:hypothetical protein Q1695_013566 [Nippostrongylus brasiliensis]|nr:hypothetical protein Q1695_013566 [Nippostrongylus brasiliensis]
MGDSSPEPLDELEEPRGRRVHRWQSVRVVAEPNGSPAAPRGLRRTGTVPSMRRKPNKGDRLDPFGGQHSYLRVPGHSGRTSPSVASNTSEPESCIDDARYQDDDDVDIGESHRLSIIDFSSRFDFALIDQCLKMRASTLVSDIGLEDCWIYAMVRFLLSVV